MSVKLTIQTVLIFVALDRFLNPIMGSILPINGIGVLISFLYWFLLLGFSYGLAIYLTKK